MNEITVSFHLLAIILAVHFITLLVTRDVFGQNVMKRCE
jgi:hypothetical protein